MKKVSFFLLLVVSGLIFSGCTGEPQLSRKEICLDEGGEWKEFPNSCVDSCQSARNDDVMCAQVITEGCDCGPDRCWNGESCVAN